MFCITASDLKPQHRRLFNKIEKDSYKHLLSESNNSQNALLVYPSHPVTDHIIDSFLNLLENGATKSIRSRMIAILPIRRHRSGSGLQISGITLERLTNEANKSPRVVFFDDGVVSGRTYEEIKRLLSSLGYRDIHSLMLLDRQRLPSIDHLKNEKHVCYWRLDVPSLGGKAHCPLCHAIDRVKALSDSIVSRAHKMRIHSWCDSWRELDPCTEWGDAGLRPIPLTLKKPARRFAITRNNDGTYSQIGGDEQQIRITNSAGLITWVTELHTVTSRDDLYFRLIELEKEAMTSVVRIQLLSTQLLLFHVEFDSDHALNLGNELLEALWHSKEHDRHTALACLTLMSCGDLFLKAVIDNFLDKSDRLYELEGRSLDVLLLIALKLSVEQRELMGIIANPRLDVVNRLLKPCGKPDLYYRLHREVKDHLGKSHSSPLCRLFTTSESMITQNHLMDVQGSAAQIMALVNEIPHYFLRDKTEAHKQYINIKKEINKKEDELRESIAAVYDNRCNSNIELLKTKGRELLDEGDKLHNGLFFSLQVQKLKNGFPDVITEFFESLMESIHTEEKVIKWHLPGRDETCLLAQDFLEKNNVFEAYIVWDSEIQKAVLDVLSNVRHVDVNEMINNPWGNNKDIEVKAHLWCKIEMNQSWFNLVMQNKSKHKHKEIDLRTSYAHSHHILKEIGGNVKYNDKNDGIVETFLSIPYAHTLQTLPKESSNG